MGKSTNVLVSIAFVLALLIALPAASVQAQEDGEVIAEGFNGPLGLLLASDGSIYVIDSGTGGDTPIQFMDPATGQPSEAMMGDTSRIVQVMPDGTQNEIATLPSVHVGQDMIGGARLAMLDGVLYATSGEWHEDQGERSQPLLGVVVEVADGEVSPVIDTWAAEVAINPDGAQVHSHPYGLVVGPDGLLYIADAAANALLTGNPSDGSVNTVTAFDPLPGVFPNPNRNGEMLTDAVPTGVAFDDDGNAYVSILSGAPFIPGSAKIVKVAPDGSQSDFATGLTMMVDIARGPDGELYAVQFGQFTDQGPVPNSGALLHIVEGEGSTPVLEGLSFPTSLAFDDAGDVYLTINGVGAPGSGQVVKHSGIATTGMADSASDEMGAETDDAMSMEGEHAEGDMAESDMAEGDDAMSMEGQDAEGDMAEGDMAEGDDAMSMEDDHAEGDMAESDMDSPAMLPTTGASLPNTQFAVIAMLGVLSVGAYIAYRRKE